MKKSELLLLPHDPAWKDDFQKEKDRITAVLRDRSALIEHVGSTSIPNVYAKPILDIAILCGEGGVDPVVQALLQIGYEFRGQYDDARGHYYALLDYGDVRLCQAHIYTAPNEDWHNKLRFREALSRDSELAKEYTDYKLSLAASVSNKSEYAEIKTRWVDTFILKVLEKSAS